MKARLLEKFSRAPSIDSFRFMPAEPFTFLPGQFVRVVFDPVDESNSALNKYLSLSSPPGRECFELTKRLSDSRFSQRLRSLKRGDEVFFQGPMGTCVFRPEYTNIGILAGGVGITPAISIIEHIADNNLKTRVCLLYSTSDVRDTAFRNELEALTKNVNIEVSFTVDEPARKQEPLSWRISRELIAGKMAGFKQEVIFIFGPPAMVKAMAALCKDMGCPAGKLRQESFVGY